MGEPLALKATFQGTPQIHESIQQQNTYTQRLQTMSNSLVALVFSLHLPFPCVGRGVGGGGAGKKNS